jgi:hypothetical protein
LFYQLLPEARLLSYHLIRILAGRQRDDFPFDVRVSQYRFASQGSLLSSKIGGWLGEITSQSKADKLIEEWTSQHDNMEVMYLLQDEGVPAGPVQTPADAYNDPQLKDRGFFEKVTQADVGTYLYPGMLWKMSKTPLSIRKATLSSR